jgi:membrane-bound lytic murein transglycosylase B
MYNRRVGRALALVLLLLCWPHDVRTQEPPAVAPVAAEPPPFDIWLAGVRDEAIGRGIRPDVVALAFEGVQPVPQILERDRGQAEFTLDLDAYLKRRLTPSAVRMARQMYRKHGAVLRRVGATYAVDPRIVVAVWGLESNFGRFAGVRPTIPTLATLAYDQRRSALFRSELFHALEILNRGDIDLPNLRGSWAGALGQPQFLPSSYLQYAQDFDGDGRRDIWTSMPDVFASIAYYLQQHGWTDGVRWGREVWIAPAAREAALELPRRETGCRAVRLMSVSRPLREWGPLGFRTLARRPLPASELPASLVTAGTRRFLVYANYEALLGYNCAHSYALSVALLADRLT